MRGSGRGLFLLGRTEKTPKNFRQMVSVIAESNTGHLLVCCSISFCIVRMHKQLHICNSYDCDCVQLERLLTFVVDVTKLEKYQILFCF